MTPTETQRAKRKRRETAAKERIKELLGEEIAAETWEPPEFLRDDPELLDGLLAEFCRQWVEDGQPFPPMFLASLVERFHAIAAERKKAKPAKPRKGDHAVGRAVAALVAFGWRLKDAKEAVAVAAGIDADNCVRAYRRWRRSKKPPA